MTDITAPAKITRLDEDQITVKMHPDNIRKFSIGDIEIRQVRK